MRISIIVPVLNEASTLADTLQALQSLRERQHELIVVDGGSDDDTVARAMPLADRIIHSPRGRAVQMNRGAQAASGELLLFLHADSHLPENAEQIIARELRDTQLWGRFDVRLSGARPMFRVIAFMINLRSRISGIATGDQAIFVRRKTFDAVGGYPEIALMEDIALSKRLKHLARPLCLRDLVVTSSRRWQQRGLWRTVLLMWRLRLAYFFGADPDRLARIYR